MTSLERVCADFRGRHVYLNARVHILYTNMQHPLSRHMLDDSPELQSALVELVRNHSFMRNFFIYRLLCISRGHFVHHTAPRNPITST
jgi:hypothetical protein